MPRANSMSLKVSHFRGELNPFSSRITFLFSKEAKISLMWKVCIFRESKSMTMLEKHARTDFQLLPLRSLSRYSVKFWASFRIRKACGWAHTDHDEMWTRTCRNPIFWFQFASINSWVYVSDLSCFAQWVDDFLCVEFIMKFVSFYCWFFKSR